MVIGSLDVARAVSPLCSRVSDFRQFCYLLKDSFRFGSVGAHIASISAVPSAPAPRTLACAALAKVRRRLARLPFTGTRSRKPQDEKRPLNAKCRQSEG